MFSYHIQENTSFLMVLYFLYFHLHVLPFAKILFNCSPTVEGVWLVAGVKQPHLARVGLIGLGGGGGAAHLWGMKQSSPRVKTATPTHTQD